MNVVERPDREGGPVGTGCPDDMPVARELAADPTTGRPCQEGLLLSDLFQPLGALPALAAQALRCGCWADAFLASAAAVQVTEDAMAGGTGLGQRSWWRQLSAELEGPGLAREAVLTAVSYALGAADLAAENSPFGHALAVAARAQAELRDVLAPGAAGTATPDQRTVAGLAEQASAAVERLPAGVRSQVLRLPSCFRSFDQHFEDVRELVAMAAIRWPARSRPLAFVGIRTSGSYLAPLAAAYAKAAGYADVSVATLRPGVRPSSAAREVVAKVASRSGLVMLTDDPPVTGRSVARVAARLERMGVKPDALVLLLGLPPGQASLSPGLRRYPAVLLPWERWYVHRLLAPGQVAQTVERLAGDCRVVSCAAQERPMAVHREHIRLRYDLVLERPGAGGVRHEQLVVEGTGLGFFGRHALAVTRALGGAVPPVLGFADGLVYSYERPGAGRRVDVTQPSTARAVARYVKLRHDAMPAAGDPTGTMGGRLPLWEAASRALAPLLGRPAPLMRMGLLVPFTRRLLATGDASVVDGHMDAASWSCDGEHLTKRRRNRGVLELRPRLLRRPVRPGRGGGRSGPRRAPRRGWLDLAGGLGAAAGPGLRRRGGEEVRGRLERDLRLCA